MKWLLLISSVLVGCKTTPDVAPVFNTIVVAPDQASLVSVQATGSGTAEVVVKSSRSLTSADWQLTAESLNPTATNKQTLDLFDLTTFQVSGLVPEHVYRFKLRFVYNHTDTLTIERAYEHHPNTYWRRLAHVPIDAGDFTGSILSSNDLSYLQTPMYVSVERYVTDQQGDGWLYDIQANTWLISPVFGLIPHNPVRFRLEAVQGIMYVFTGLGYLDNDLVPRKRIYLKSMVAIGIGGGPVHPDYAGKDGEVVFFTTFDRAFQLTQESSRELWVRRGNWAQYQGHDFPEQPGTLATFTINNTGYVVNQRDGLAPHVFAYNTDTDQWTRKADFPGGSRSRGVGFSIADKGYFGLGITGDDEQGLRDLWQYDPATDHWQYVTDYPGQGNRYLVVNNVADRAYLGWGYESQAVPSGGSRVVGCTDFWEFKP